MIVVKKVNSVIFNVFEDKESGYLCITGCTKKKTFKFESALLGHINFGDYIPLRGGKLLLKLNNPCHVTFPNSEIEDWKIVMKGLANCVVVEN